LFNALSVDVEDWFQVGAFENVISRDSWDARECRVERNTDALLAMFDEAQIKATFFTLGWVAERYPGLMRRIVDAGHELGNHGCNHDRVFNFTPAQFAADLDRSRKTIEDTGGAIVKGYRAPSFSINKNTPWAHEIMAEQGYVYSSSINPIAHDHYGDPDAPRGPHDAGDLVGRGGDARQRRSNCMRQSDGARLRPHSAAGNSAADQLVNIGRCALQQ